MEFANIGLLIAEQKNQFASTIFIFSSHPNVQPMRMLRLATKKNARTNATISLCRRVIVRRLPGSHTPSTGMLYQLSLSSFATSSSHSGAKCIVHPHHTCHSLPNSNRKSKNAKDNKRTRKMYQKPVERLHTQ